ncbi:uncharacterized protein LOC126265562 [Aethina tumida]|uniref:uncharacterized protein LOC126265562 n=1 Tax=Aethina tumida TaxID=116153 RepID=UPI002148432C|nr:uncharacterized protein LOC126265562 [Aethina tumida]
MVRVGDMLVVRLLISLILATSSLAMKQMIIRKAEMCELEKNYQTKFYASVTNKGGFQHLTANITITEPWGDNVVANLVFYVSRDDKKFDKFSEGKFGMCYFVKTFLGPFGNELFRIAKILPGTCPIPKGNYYIKDYKLDFRTILVAEVLPIGTFRVIGHNVEKSSGRTLVCYNLEMEVIKSN